MMKISESHQDNKVQISEKQDYGDYCLLDSARVDYTASY